MVTRLSSSAFAVLVLFLFALSGCNRSATSALPPATTAANPNQISPDVWEKGPTPVQWAIFTHPTNSTHYAWPVADPANNVWFESDNRIERINYSGSNLGTFATITSGPLANLTLGGDGNVWYLFTSNSPNPAGVDFVNAVDSSGKLIHEYQLPGTGQANVVFRGNGTDMWAGRFDSDNPVGGSLFLIRSGKITRFICEDTAIQGAVTPDGKVWFVGFNSAGDFIDVMDPTTGKCHEIFIGNALVRPGPMTLGSDGNPWLLDTGSNGSVLIRINRSTETRSNFGVGLHIIMTDLISGPDKDLWISFHTTTATGLIRFSPSSGTVVNRFICPAQFCANAPANSVTDLTNAPDGNIYFAYNGVDAHAGIGAYVRLSMTITPSSVAFTRVGATQLLKIAEANYTGTWSVATTTPSVVKVVSRPASNEALIQAVGPGTGRVIVRDTRNNYYGVAVTVP